MRQYQIEESNKLLKVVCNCCGRQMKVENGYLKEECFGAVHAFGYFSKRDGIRHRFDLCEACYEKWTGSFTVPVDEEEVRELL